MQNPDRTINDYQNRIDHCDVLHFVKTHMA